MRRAAKIDANQNDIVKELRKWGATVAITSALGNGFVDIVVGYGGRNYLIEIKDGSKPPSKRRLTEDEQAFHDAWRGQVTVVETVEEALAVINITIN